jgi:hypothetical protein
MSEGRDTDGPPVIDPTLPVDDAAPVVLSPEAKKAQAEALKKKALKVKEADAAFLEIHHMFQLSKASQNRQNILDLLDKHRPLVDSGDMDLNRPQPGDQSPLLVTAVWYQWPRVVHWLLFYGKCSPNATTLRGNSALHVAVRCHI